MSINKLTRGITELTESFKIQNKHFSFTVDKRSGKVCEIINLHNGENINTEGADFIYLTDHDRNKILPKSLEADGVSLDSDDIIELSECENARCISKTEQEQ